MPEDATDDKLTRLFLGGIAAAFGVFVAVTPFGLLPRVLGLVMAIGAAALVLAAFLPGMSRRGE